MIIVVIGKTCSGKTTLGRYLETNYGFGFIEASTLFGRISGLTAVGGNDLSCAIQAYTYLKSSGLDLVAKQASLLMKNRQLKDIVISGFRLTAEVSLIRRNHCSCNVIQINCSDSNRFNRNLDRHRKGHIETMTDFLALEASFGADGIQYSSNVFADHIVTNDSSVDIFHNTINRTLSLLT